MPSCKPKQNFIALFNWMHAQIDFEKMQQDPIFDYYFLGMEWYKNNIAGGNYIMLDDETAECLFTLHSGFKTTADIAHITGFNVQSLNTKMTTLVNQGFAVAYRPKPGDKIHYRLTPLGKQEIIKRTVE